MKYQRLKKQVLTESGILAAALAILGGSVFGLDTLRDDYHANSSALQDTVNTINSTTNTLQEKYFKVQKNAAVFQEATQKQAHGELTISRQTLRDKFNLFNGQYYLSSMRLSLSAIDDQTAAKYKRATYVITGSDVTIDFEATSDEDVFGLMNGMEQQLPGSSRITLVKLSRQKPLTDEVLRTVSQKGVYPMVAGQIQFKWFGLKPLETSETHTDAPPPN